MTALKNLIKDLTLVLASGRKLMLPAIHPKELSAIMSSCSLCKNPWIRTPSRDITLEFPFVIQPCQHTIGSSCLRSALNEGDLRCPICDISVEAEIIDGMPKAEFDPESAAQDDDSPLSDAPDSPRWPVEQEPPIGISQDLVDTADPGDSQTEMDIFPDQSLPMQESPTPLYTEKQDQKLLAREERICHTAMRQSADALATRTTVTGEKLTLEELQAALTLLGLHRPLKVTLEELYAGLAMVDLRQGFRTDYKPDDIAQILNVLNGPSQHGGSISP